MAAFLYAWRFDGYDYDSNLGLNNAPILSAYCFYTSV